MLGEITGDSVDGTMVLTDDGIVVLTDDGTVVFAGDTVSGESVPGATIGSSNVSIACRTPFEASTSLSEVKSASPTTPVLES